MNKPNSHPHCAIAPELGPVIGWTRPAADGSLHCRLWLKVAELTQQAEVVETILQDEAGKLLPESYQHHTILPLPRLAIAVCDVVLPAPGNYTILITARYRASAQVAAASAAASAALPSPEQVLAAIHASSSSFGDAQAAANCIQAYQANPEQFGSASLPPGGAQ